MTDDDHVGGGNPLFDAAFDRALERKGIRGRALKLVAEAMGGTTAVMMEGTAADVDRVACRVLDALREGRELRESVSGRRHGDAAASRFAMALLRRCAAGDFAPPTGLLDLLEDLLGASPPAQRAPAGSPAWMRAAALLAADPGKPDREVAREAGVDPATLRRWLKSGLGDAVAERREMLRILREEGGAGSA